MPSSSNFTIGKALRLSSFEGTFFDEQTLAFISSSTLTQLLQDPRQRRVFLRAGDVALTRRSKNTRRSGVVLKFSQSRGRYERQGLLVEEAALERAEAECLADNEVRERRNERARERQAELDDEYIKAFAKRVRSLFPHCLAGREHVIAQHACLKYSERVGRSAAAKRLEDEMIRLAVAAHVRHRETNYDSLLAKGWLGIRHERKLGIK